MPIQKNHGTNDWGEPSLIIEEDDDDDDGDADADADDDDDDDADGGAVDEIMMMIMMMLMLMVVLWMRSWWWWLWWWCRWWCWCWCWLWWWCSRWDHDDDDDDTDGGTVDEIMMMKTMMMMMMMIMIMVMIFMGVQAREKWVYKRVVVPKLPQSEVKLSWSISWTNSSKFKNRTHASNSPTGKGSSVRLDLASRWQPLPLSQDFPTPRAAHWLEGPIEPDFYRKKDARKILPKSAQMWSIANQLPPLWHSGRRPLWNFVAGTCSAGDHYIFHGSVSFHPPGWQWLFGSPGTSTSFWSVFHVQFHNSHICKVHDLPRP